MNYFAHAYRFLDRPYFIAGTSLPDWLNVVDRRVRCRTRHAESYCEDEREDIAELARGIVRHHRDDAAFHETRTFAELSLSLAADVRRHMADDTALRPGFVGHILVEILLDAVLFEDDPPTLERFYVQLGRVDAYLVADAVGRMTGREVGSLPEWIDRFLAERFLFDYTDDAKLLRRLNQVMRRVRLPALGEELLELLPDARRQVRRRAAALLSATHGTRRIEV
jgi:hypothetical protein